MKAKLFGLMCMALASVSTAWAVPSPCPSIGHTTFGGLDNQPYVTAGGGCNVVITIAANGSVSQTTTNANPFDGSEDTLVGVINNSPTPLTQLVVSGTGISGWDSDGICFFASGGGAGDTWTSGNSTYCAGNALSGGASGDPASYPGPQQVFSNFASGNAVTITFTAPVFANGGTAFFSVEEAPDTALSITIPPPTAGIPVPSSVLLMMAGLLAIGTFYLFGRRAASAL